MLKISAIPVAWSRALLRSLLGQDCVLCGVRSDRSLVCERCEGLLTVVREPCSRCGATAAGGGVCGICLQRPPPFESVISAYAYGFPVDRLVQRFKHAADLATGRWLAGRLAETASREPRPDALVAPPLFAGRLRERGFNQSQVLARHVGSALGIPVIGHGVWRIRDTASQAGLGREARRRNLRGTFACDLDLAGRRIAIVDDVVTTGATAESLASALAAAGARSVVVWAVARTPAPSART